VFPGALFSFPKRMRQKNLFAERGEPKHAQLGPLSGNLPRSQVSAGHRCTQRIECASEIRDNGINSRRGPLPLSGLPIAVRLGSPWPSSLARSSKAFGSRKSPVSVRARVQFRFAQESSKVVQLRRTESPSSAGRHAAGTLLISCLRLCRSAHWCVATGCAHYRARS